ncbi:hypothetical protein CWO84_16740 [Methylomonas sp. Kb3]|uniref:hypothetical protein n=1 Tax=Methylomonas sp. Kb3 TaxID=1611544 RepID=UPI000C34BFB5|nr:hypothetical protein [Methylomonas sp. Kb3]PKD39357.1 hypothetical protein CWO84_16740 [Methylomonas sp. Kb3]
MGRLVFMLWLLLGLAPLQTARALDMQEVPEPLKPWISWVLADETQYRCPFIFDDFQQKHCAWPGALHLNLQAKHGSFVAEWTVYRQDWISLPGDTQHWPQAVTVNKQTQPVVEKDGKPALYLPAGHYQISGEFFWESLPEQLALPEASGLIQLSVNDKPVAYPPIKQGALWLNTENADTADREQDRLDLQVFRQVQDEVPLQVITRLDLEVSGKAREIEFPYALLPNFIPVALNSPLPARLDGNGRLLVQVRPGRWSIDIHARHPQALTQLDLAVKDENWPAQELWAFQAVPALRLVEIENLTAIDGSQTNLPAEWQHLPTYQLQQGESMKFKVMRRGDPEPEPNQLKLQRTLWLDFEGGGYTVSDNITGTMSRDWRLNAVPELGLGQVQLDGQNQLITQLADGNQGVEVRRGAIQLNADSRIEADLSSLSASGWQQRFQQVQAELNIPPGWRLLAVSGVDNVPNSWLNRWTLLDLFLVLIAALAVGRLWSPQWGAFALLSLALIWHEADAPRLIWLNVLAVLALLRVLPAGSFWQWLKWYRNASWLALLMLTIPFMVAQIRIGLYPQLELPRQPIQRLHSMVSTAAPMAMQVEQMADSAMAPERSDSGEAERGVYFKKSVAPVSPYGGSSAILQRVDPEANLQTGPGLPHWGWQKVDLSWNGAVDNGQQIGLWYLSPFMMMLLHFAQALLVAVLVLKMLGAIATNWRLSLPSLTCLLLLPLLMAPSEKAYADLPDAPMLEQLKTRLLQAPQCLPNCAQFADMQLLLKPEVLRIELQLHAQQDLAVPLPAQLEQWFPEQVSVDGGEAQALIRQDDGSLWLVVNAGVHKVTMQGRYAAQDKFSLPLPLPPQHAGVIADGWRVDGLYEDGKVGPQLEFSRLQLDTGPKNKLQQTALPAFVRVERTLHLGLDWRVTTRVEQLAGALSPVLLELPLLPGEAVTSPQVRVKDGKVLVNMAAGQATLEWESALAKTEQLTLQAADTPQWTEVWRADVSPIWHLQADGIAVVHHQDGQGQWLPEWRPWPGEKVNLTIGRPQAVAGSTLTIDRSELAVKPGQRSETVELILSIRSSKGGQHPVKLPEQAELQSVTIDGVSQPIRQQGATVSLPIHPGTQQIVLNWQTAKEPGVLLRTPLVDLGVASVNSRIQLLMPQQRWLLWTFGPKFGPAVLIWGLLIVLALLALGLGKFSITPLRHWQWFLLLIGLSQLHIAAAFLVVGWLFALGLRAGHAPQRPRWFNLAQIGLAGLTLLSLLLIAIAVEQGLLGEPDMQIAGNQSSATLLNWYQDRNGPQLAVATVVSLPLLAYRILMLAWSLWMAATLLNWLRWGWNCFIGGGLWKKSQPPVAVPKSEA